MQLLLQVCISQLLFAIDKTKMNIQTELHDIIPNPDKLYLCESCFNRQQNWPKKMDIDALEAWLSIISTCSLTKFKINIEKELCEIMIITKPDKLQIVWSYHNTKQKFPKKIPVPASLFDIDCPYFPLAVCLLDRPRCW